jgi:hypothetical protein
MGLPNRVPPPEQQQPMKPEEVEFETKRAPWGAIVGIVCTLIALGFIIWWFLA